MFEDILLEKLAEGYDEEDLAYLIKEAAEESGYNGEEDSLTEEELMKLAEYMDEDELEELVAEVEAEKTAQSYYEMGQVMAHGFNDELEKEAAGALSGAKHLVQYAPAKLKSVLKGMKGRGSKAYQEVKPAAKSFKDTAEQRVMRKEPLLSRLRRVGSATTDMTNKEKRRLREAAKGLGLAGAGATGVAGTGYAATRAMKGEKKSGAEEVYNALAVLESYGLLER